MTKITQIEDRSAASAWSPIREYGDVIAIGAKDSGGVGFDETGGELELYDLQLSHPTTPVLLGSVKTTSRFATLAWTAFSLGGRYPLGMLAGGMEDGTVYVWNPKAVMDGTEALIASFSQQGPVKALQFNALNPTQLATGGSDGKVVIFHLDQLPHGGPLTPSDSNQQRSQITAVAWNTQVAHILASAAADGTVAVWDLKGRKAWCELRAENGLAVADLAWNPTQGLHLLTASADDRNPVIKLWDLRSSTSMPLTTLTGHHQGLLSIAWCPHDDHLLLSCAKDNRTILWDLFTLQPIVDVPNDTPDIATDTGAQDAFATGGLASSQQRRYDVQWSPIKRGVASTCSLDRKVQAHSILALSSQSGRPPKWMRPASSVSCGFGGSIVSCGAKDKFVRMRTVVEQPELANLSLQFESTMASTQVSDYCQSRAAKATEAGEAQLWAFMQVIFETNARQQLLDTLGFDPDAIAHAAAAYADNPTVNGVEGISLDDKLVMSTSTEEMVKKALLVGNFEAAVECCFQTGNLADALVLASCGGPDLWAKAQQRYFESQSAKRPFLSTVSAIIHNQLDQLVLNSDPGNWHETLAILSTYGKSDEFPNLCIALGDVLEKAGDSQSASLCYMCSLSLDRAVRFWRSQLEQSNKKKGGLDIKALHDFVVKVSVFLMAIGPNAQLDAEDAELFTTYASKLAEQGLFVAAAKYSRGDSMESLILRDRLYRSKASPDCLAAMGGVAPDFPFSFVDIQKSRGPTIDRAAQQAQAQAHAAQQAQAQAQAAQYSQSGYGVQQDAYSQSTQQAAYATQQHQSTYSAQQQQTTSNSATSYAAPPETVASSDALPPDWMAIQDPSSGHYYYANQVTGEVTWDRPQMAPQPAPAPQPVQPSTPVPNGKPTRTSALASKYGDGFVTSSSHPELASQYGNVGTSNPYATTARPGTAQVSATPSKAPVSANLDPDRIPELREDYIPVKDCFLSLVDALKNLENSVVDKRLLVEGEKGVAVLLKRLARGDISDEIGQQVLHMCGYINSYDFGSAERVQTTLVSHEWRDHKDWLKGTKSLVQLCIKKFAQ